MTEWRTMHMSDNVEYLNIFISYSHKNMKYKEKLLTSLEALKQSYNIEAWHDGMIDAGGNIDINVKQAMSKSNIVLLLVTDNFIASQYCMKIELEAAIKREKSGKCKCKVIPVMFQESVLSDNLAFIKHNRVPEDGRPIATGFKNQSVGCARAVNMIKNMIDKEFPNSKKNIPRGIANRNSTKVTATSIKRKPPTLCIELYKNGKLSNIPINQNMLNLLPKYHKAINSFRTMMDQSLIEAKKRFQKLYKTNHGEISSKQKLEYLRLYLMDMCAYTKTYITENVGIKVHFRVSKDNYYLGLIASTDDDNSTDLASDWTTKMTPIPMYEGLIYHSSKLGTPIIKIIKS